MRLPIVPTLSTKDGTSNKNARLTNCLKEAKKTGDKAVIRPGLVLDAQASGVGNGLVSFNGELVSVYGSMLAIGAPEQSDWIEYADATNAAGHAICYGNGKFYIVDTAWSFYTTTDLTDVVLKSSFGSGVTAGLLSGIAAGNGLVCYITGDSASGDSADVAWSADDAATWTVVDDAIGNGLITEGPAYSSIHFDGTHFIASVVDIDDVSSVWRSLDCVTWTACGNIISDGDYAVSWCTGLGYTYAMTASGACAYTANNGLTWTTHPTLNATRDVGTMVLSGSALVAIGDIGGVPYLYRSTDGTTFSETSYAFLVGGGGSPNYLSVITGALVWTISTVNYYTSTDDGLNWTAKTDYSGAYWNRGAYGGGVAIFLDMSDRDASIIGTGTNGYIPALTTITGTSFDFAQSPL